MTESDLIAAIIQLIDLKGGQACRVNSGVMVIRDEEKGKTRVFKGAAKGTADILACYRGHFLALECKIGNNEPSLEQVAFLMAVKDAGGIGKVVYSVEEAQAILESIDLGLKARIA